MQSNLPRLSAPAQRALVSINVSCLEDLTKFTEKQIVALHGMGPNAMSKLKLAMHTLGLEFI